MSSQPQPSTPELHPGQPAGNTQYYLRILHELIDLGADLARTVHQQAKAQAEAQPEPARPGAAPAPDLTLQFERVTRAVRRTILLARKLGEPARAISDPARHRVAARKRIIREVEDAIGRHAEAADANSLHAELLDRLDTPDLEDDIGLRPIPDIIDEICCDLGIDPMFDLHPWRRRTPADIETLCARAASPHQATTRQATAQTTRPDPAVTRNRPPRNDPPSDPAEAVAKVLHYGALQRAR